MITYAAINILDGWFPVIEKFEQKSDPVSSIISGFSFTMVGLITAVLTFLLSHADRAFIVSYRKDGSMRCLILFISIAVITLFLTFAISLFQSAFGGLMHSLLTFCVLSVLQVAVFTYVSMNIAIRSK